jgi:glucose-6-phosphate 1-epimerase
MSETRAVTTLDQLRRRFNIPGIAEVHGGRGGLAAVRVTSPVATGEMYLHGGHVTSWVPAGGDEVLFVSAHARFEDGRAIRGGVPVCYPWFGALDGRPDAPAHGCVRTRAWQLDAVEQTDAGVTVTMSTTSDDHTRGYWPGDFRVEHRVTFGPSLTMKLTTLNTGTTAFDLQEALHTYYRVGSIHDVRVDGLQGVAFLDALDARRERRQDGAITFAAEVDRIYLGTGMPITIDDGALNRRILIGTEHSRTTVVWNPWIRKARALADLGDDEWRDFVCVESCNVPPAAVTIGPGQRHVMRAVVEVA